MKKDWYLWLIAIAFTALVQGCGSAQKEPQKDLVVVEQRDSIIGVQGDCASFLVDVPVNGPQHLVDSVLALLNSQVYKMCEYCTSFEDRPDEAVTYSPQEVFTADAEHLLSHYVEKYKRLMEDSLWNTFSLEMKLEAQTENFVTYGLEFMHCGAGCGSEKSYFTFSKADGHQVREIITHQNLVQFFQDHPEYKTVKADPWAGELSWEFSEAYEFSNSQFGLLGQHFTLSINEVVSHYFLVDIPYTAIHPYLTPEAQALSPHGD
jgi:hypothetical protein